MRYSAFLSYSRKDEKVAAWLQRRLDAFRTPKTLVGARGAFGPAKKSLYPVFRDRTDMAGGGRLAARIESALRDSDALIVLCSVDACASPWVNREVEAYEALGRADRVVAVIAPDQHDSDDIERDFFPPALRGRGLLAVDLRGLRRKDGRFVGDGREHGLLKLIAGLLGVELDALLRREQARSRARMTTLIGATAVFALLAVAAVTMSIVAERRAVAERQQRERADDAAIEVQRQTEEAQLQAEEARRQSNEAERQRAAALQAEIYMGRGDYRTASLDGPLAGDRGFGDPNAPVKLIQYSSLMCPHCSRFQAIVMPELQRRYIGPGHVYVIVREIPTAPQQVTIAGYLTARCVAPNEYDEAVALLLERQQQIFAAAAAGRVRDQLLNIAEAFGVSAAQLDVCLADEAAIERLQTVAARATNEIGIQSVPAYVVDGSPPMALHDLDQFIQVIDSAVAQTR